MRDDKDGTENENLISLMIFKLFDTESDEMENEILISLNFL